MKVHSHLPGHKSRRHLLALSCATALASFALIARPALAEEATGEVALTSDNTVTVGTESIQTTADLVETSPTSTSEADPVASNSEQAQNETADSTEIAGTQNESTPTVADTTASTNNPSETSDFRSVTATTSANPIVTPENTVTGGHYYSDSSGNWYYKDANGNNVTGQQTIDGVKVYFRDYGMQIKGDFAPDGHYYDKDSGAMVTNKLVKDSSKSYYYFDANGNRVIGEYLIDGTYSYFDKYGQFRDRFDPNGYYYDNEGKRVDFGTNRYVNFKNNWYYAGSNGAFLKGAQTIDGQEVYFDSNGKQVKGEFVSKDRLQYQYYDKDSGALVKNSFVIAFDKEANINNYKERKYQRYYLNEEGIRVTGEQTINGKNYYFKKDGSQAFDLVAPNRRYYDSNGDRVDFDTNRYVQIKHDWYYVGPDGTFLSGAHTIGGQDVYFDYLGRQAKGTFGNAGIFYDYDSGTPVTNRFVTSDGKSYYIGADSKALKGQQVIDGKTYYFHPTTGAQIKGDFDDKGTYYDDQTGASISNRYVLVKDHWYYIGADGKRLTGAQTINGDKVYFDYNGKQIKGGFAYDGHYYDKDSGALIDLGRNRYVFINDNWYYVDEDGKRVKGDQTINGDKVYFDYEGKQVKGDFINFREKYYDKDTGTLVTNSYFNHKGHWYYADQDGNILKGAHTIDGVDVYFDYYDGQAKDTIVNGYYYDKDTGQRKEAVPRQQFVEVGGDIFYYDAQGKPLSGAKVIDGTQYYFFGNGKLLRGAFGPYGYGPYYDAKTGAAILKEGLLTFDDGTTYYILPNGQKYTGLKEIDGKLYNFHQPVATKYSTGHLVKGELSRPREVDGYVKYLTPDENPLYYFDAETGAAVTNRYLLLNGDWYYFGADGKALFFDQVINGQHVYFGYDGKQVKGEFVTDYHGLRYFDENTGNLLTDTTRVIDGITYHFDKDGKASFPLN